MVETAGSWVLEKNKSLETGLYFRTSVVSRVGFLRCGFVLAVLNAVGKWPELREVLIRFVRKGRMLPEMSGGKYHSISHLSI